MANTTPIAPNSAPEETQCAGFAAPVPTIALVGLVVLGGFPVVGLPEVGLAEENLGGVVAFAELTGCPEEAAVAVE